jgi:hypothetical protein
MNFVIVEQQVLTSELQTKYQDTTITVFKENTTKAS